jgi:hypothetical protein
VIADAPHPMNLSSAMWTGREMVVVGSEVDDRNRATTGSAVGQAYDPAADTWRDLGAVPVSAQTAAVSLVGERIVAWEHYSPKSAEYLEDEGTWRSVYTPGIEGGECYAQGAAVETAIVTWDCGSPMAWFAETSSWHDIGRPITPDDPVLAFDIGRVYPAGSAVVVDHGEIGVDSAPPRPSHLWLWRAAEPPPRPVAAAGDAKSMVEGFLADWYEPWHVFLPGVASVDVIARSRSGVDAAVLDGRTYRAWNIHDPVATGPGAWTVEVVFRAADAPDVIAVYTVGDGIAADGREGLVITDVRLAP